jgi:hypothetical protein
MSPDCRGIAVESIGLQTILVSSAAPVWTAHNVYIGNAHVPRIGPAHDGTDAATEYKRHQHNIINMQEFGNTPMTNLA